MGPQDQLKFPRVVQEKLLPDEKPVRQLASGRSNFVATNKRLLRFSAGGFEPLDYQKISAVSYQTSPSDRTVRIIIGFALIMLLLLTIGTWIYTLIYIFSPLRISIFSASVRTSVTDAVIITLACGVNGVIGIISAARHMDYYQIESKTYDQINNKSWQITRRPWYLGNSDVEEFVKTVKEQITI